MNAMQLRTITCILAHHYPNADKTEKIIINCALVAASADAVGGLIPGLAIPATIVTCFGAVWVMYARLCNELGIELKENVLKLLARAALANIAANLGGSIAAVLASMFIPGASALASAAVAFLTVYLAGLVFLQLVLRLAEKSSDKRHFSDISTGEMKQEIKNAKVSADDLAAAREAYESCRNAADQQAT